MLGLTSLEVYNSIFSITQEDKKIQLYTDTFPEVSFEEFKDELEEILNISDNTPYQIQHEKIGPRIIESYKKLISEKSSTDGYVILLTSYASSPFRDFDSCISIVVCFNEDDIQLILKQYNSTLSLLKKLQQIKAYSD